jgi:hypothetical protein
MRFTKRKKLIEAYENNTNKIITKFLLFPVTIDGETRWFEEATIEMRVKRESTLMLDYSYYWVYSKFID